MALHNDVFKDQIWRFFCDDLDSCLLVSKLKQSGDARFKGGLNFTACLAIFSAIEFLAGFFVGKEPASDDIALFFQKYFSEYWEKLRDKSFSKKFYEVFRNGLSHQWSPKASGVQMDFNGGWILRKDKPPGFTEEILIINIPSFFEITKKAFKNFEGDLDKNSAYKVRFKERYDKLVANDYMEMRILRKYLTP